MSGVKRLVRPGLAILAVALTVFVANLRWFRPFFANHFHELQAGQTGVPTLRKVVPFPAFSEGWALYAEHLTRW